MSASEYIFRWPADVPELTFEALAPRLAAICDRELCTSCYGEIGTTVQFRWLLRTRTAIMLRLYGTTIAILSDDGAVQFPHDDPHQATTEWVNRVIRDNGLGRRAWRIRRHASDGPGPKVARGHAGLLVMGGDRDRPVYGVVHYREQWKLESLRSSLRAQDISYGELAELQALAPWIQPDDTELLEAAGVPEFPAERVP